MANLNKVMLIGRLTRDPEVQTFQSGGKVAKFGFAVSERRKNRQTGQWEDGDPLFIDCEGWNKGDSGTLANIIEQYLSKGMLCYLEGRLKLDSWDDKNTGQKRQKMKMTVDVMQMLDSKNKDGGEQRGPSDDRYQTQDTYDQPAGGGFHPGNEEIPF